MTSLVRIAVPAVCILAAAACNRDRSVDRDRTERPSTVQNEPTIGTPGTDMTREIEERTGTTTVTGANVGRVGNQSAIDKIVAARCAREASCKNVGADKRFATSDACTKNIRSDMRDDLGAKECPAGVDQKELNECLESIQKEDCNNPIDAISRLAACRTSDLCLNTGAPNR